MSILDSAILRAIASKEDKLVAGAVSVVAILATTAIYYFLGSSDNEDEFPKLRGIQLYHAWSFFTRRHDFLFSNFERHMGKGFSFHVLSHKVIALTGNEARHTFFSHPNFDLNEGFKIFKGAVRFFWRNTWWSTDLDGSRLLGSATWTRRRKILRDSTSPFSIRG